MWYWKYLQMLKIKRILELFCDYVKLNNLGNLPDINKARVKSRWGSNGDRFKVNDRHHGKF